MLIAVSVVLLIALGVGLGTLVPRPQAEAPAPTAAIPAPAADAPVAPGLPSAVGDYTSDEPIARVGDVTITRGDFVRLYEPGVDPTELLDQLVMRELVVQAAAGEGVTVDEEQVTTVIDQIKLSQVGGDDAQFEAFLAENQIGTVEELRALIGRDQLIEQMVLRHTQAEHVHARHILLSGETPEAIAEREAEAEELLAQLEDGAEFAALAAEHSDDPGSAVEGGDLGWAPRGIFVPQFDEAVFSMDVGELRLVESQFGWHIIEVLDEPELRSFDSMELLNTQAGQVAFESTFLPWADALRSDAESAGEIEILVAAEDLVTASPGV
ncbi:MAG: peptidylprolyl isomerase [Oscillochloris sp.]|nr:peptidylprolyl isomerase [Oscillochloris sp.]